MCWVAFILRLCYCAAGFEVGVDPALEGEERDTGVDEQESRVNVFSVFVDYVEVGEVEARPELRAPFPGVPVHQYVNCVVAEALPWWFELADYHYSEEGYPRTLEGHGDCPENPVQ